MRKQVHIHIERQPARTRNAVASAKDCGCATHTGDATGGSTATKKPAAGKPEVKPPPLHSFKTHGPAGGNLAHHREKSKHHAKMAEKCDDQSLGSLHNQCSNSHAMAAHYLQSAQHHEGGAEGMASAQRHANVASQYEIKIKAAGKKTGDK